MIRKPGEGSPQPGPCRSPLPQLLGEGPGGGAGPADKRMVRRPGPPDLHQHGAVRGDCSRERAVEGAELLLLPEIARRLPAREAEIGPARGDGLPLRPAVEQANSRSAIRERPRPDLAPAVERSASGLFAQRVLVDVDYLVVGEQGSGPGIEPGEI